MPCAVIKKNANFACGLYGGIRAFSVFLRVIRLPIGTGRFAAMIPGAPGHEVIAFNDETL
jgi:hypothetical protein